MLPKSWGSGVSAIVRISAWIACLTLALNLRPAAAADALPSWREGPAKQAIVFQDMQCDWAAVFPFEKK
jgi:hypothetical protein